MLCTEEEYRALEGGRHIQRAHRSWDKLAAYVQCNKPVAADVVA